MMHAILMGSAIYHIAVGIPCLFPNRFIFFIGKTLYAMQFSEEMDPKYLYTLKPLGAYAIFVGSICFFAYMSDSNEVKVFVSLALSALLIARAVFRIVYFKGFYDAFQVSMKRNLVNVVFNTVIGISLLSAALL